MHGKFLQKEKEQFSYYPNLGFTFNVYQKVLKIFIVQFDEFKITTIEQLYITRSTKFNNKLRNIWKQSEEITIILA